ncbi:putative oxidoreductase [Nocardia amikacinitolerans]|uniref:Putative oxidoreductase n=1 Tax=Nocardia amikacinitolerans TaxID=756689 RepID=A0A285LXC9_9NOCA|nr:DoxX family protein [Nocardia amikacinitolerans]MCP2274555.1 putative oxidoreductase [Nocardia amikacinitolerans]MCP2297099.1 putative oxidoreductase [Nocardia amikacinitolerans]SNY88296.1 putative oxidoreductase [Nocardia amikacinitolerans]
MTTTTAPTTTASTLGIDLGLLVLRLALGLTMAAHGAQKLFGWFGGNGLDRTAAFFTSQGYPAGKAAAILAGASEAFGGLAVAIGLFTPLGAAAILGVMINAIAVKWGGGFFGEKGGIEYEVLIACSAAAIALTGPGRFAVDSALPFLRPYRVAYGFAAIALGLITAAIVLLVRD